MTSRFSKKKIAPEFSETILLMVAVLPVFAALSALFVLHSLKSILCGIANPNLAVKVLTVFIFEHPTRFNARQGKRYRILIAWKSTVLTSNTYYVNIFIALKTRLHRAIKANRRNDLRNFVKPVQASARFSL